MNDHVSNPPNHPPWKQRVLVVVADKAYSNIIPIANGITIISDLTGSGYPFDVITYERFCRLKFDISNQHDIIFLSGHTSSTGIQRVADKCKEAIHSGRKVFINGHLPYYQYDENGKRVDHIIFSEALFNLKCLTAWGYGKAQVPKAFEKDPDVTRKGSFPIRINAFEFSSPPTVRFTLGRHTVGFLTPQGGAIDGSSDYLLNLLDYGKIAAYLRYGHSGIVGFANDRIEGRPIASIEVHCDYSNLLNTIDTLEIFTKKYNIPLTCLLVLSKITEESRKRWNKAADNPLIYIGSHSRTHPKQWPEVTDVYSETTGALDEQRRMIPKTGNFFNFSGWMNPTTDQIDELYPSDTIFGAQGKGARMLGLPFGKPWTNYRDKPFRQIVWRLLNRLSPPIELQLMPTCKEWLEALSNSATTPYCLSHTLWGDYKAFRNNTNYTKMVKNGFRNNLKYGLYSYGYIHDYLLDKHIKKGQTQGVHLKDQITDAIAFLASQNVIFLDTESLIKRLHDFIGGGIHYKSKGPDRIEISVYRKSALANQVKIEKRDRGIPAASGDCILSQTLIGNILYVDLRPEIQSTFMVKFNG